MYVYVWGKKQTRFCTKEEKVHILSLHFNCSSMFFTLHFFSSSKLYWTFKMIPADLGCIYKQKHRQTLPNMLWMETWTTQEWVVLLWSLKRQTHGFHGISSPPRGVWHWLAWSKLKETCKKKTPNDCHQVYSSTCPVTCIVNAFISIWFKYSPMKNNCPYLRQCATLDNSPFY